MVCVTCGVASLGGGGGAGAASEQGLELLLHGGHVAPETGPERAEDVGNRSPDTRTGIGLGCSSCVGVLHARRRCVQMFLYRQKYAKA